MATWRSVIETVTGDLLRAGYVDFANDGSFDPATETILESPPNPRPTELFTKRKGGFKITRWNGSSWDIVDINIDEAKRRKIKELRDFADAKLLEKYPPGTYLTLLNFLIDAGDKGKTDTKAAVVTWQDWILAVNDEFEVQTKTINSLTTVTEIAALDFTTSFDIVLDTDPEVKVEDVIPLDPGIKKTPRT